jgi:hypothetical protein
MQKAEVEVFGQKSELDTSGKRVGWVGTTVNRYIHSAVSGAKMQGFSQGRGHGGDGGTSVTYRRVVSACAPNNQLANTFPQPYDIKYMALNYVYFVYKTASAADIASAGTCCM